LAPCPISHDNAQPQARGGRSGHPGLALHVHKIPPTIRTHVKITCSFCGTHWARRRVSAKMFEWYRIAA
jgi:hypothetical protein